MLLSDSELVRKLRRAARPDRKPLWYELDYLTSNLAILGALDEAVVLWRCLYESGIPIPTPGNRQSIGDLKVSAVCHQLELPDISQGNPPPKYVSPSATLAERVDGHDIYLRREMTRCDWLESFEDRPDLPNSAIKVQEGRALRAARPAKGEQYSPTEADALILLREYLQLPWMDEDACLLASDIATRQSDTAEAISHLRNWYDLCLERNRGIEHAFGLRAVAGLICSGALADKTAVPRDELRRLVDDIVAGIGNERVPIRLPEVHELVGFLDRIVLKIEERGIHITQLLRPGLTRYEIDVITAHLPFRLPEEVYRLYMWRNGGNADTGADLNDLCFFNSQFLLPLEDAIRHHEGNPRTSDFYSGYMLPEMVEELDGATLFPLFTDECSGFYFVACREQPTETGMMVDCLGDGEEPRIAFASLTRMMCVLADLYDEGAEGPFLEHEDSP